MEPRPATQLDQRGMSRRKQALILTVVIGGTIAFAVWFLAYLAPDTGAEMSGHGTTAMVLGIFFSLVVGGGLMALVFFSNRRGYDENLARRDDGPPSKR